MYICICTYISKKKKKKKKGRKAFKRAVFISCVVGICLFFGYLGSFLFDDITPGVFVVSYSVFVSSLFVICVYCIWNHWIRMNHVYAYLGFNILLASGNVLFSVYWWQGYNSFCVLNLSNLMFQQLLPWLVYCVVRRDSLFWRNIYFHLQMSTKPSKMFYQSHWAPNQQFSHQLEKGDLKDSLTDYLSTKVPIIDFADIETDFEPIGKGSTAFVYPAWYRKTRHVAVKTFVLDELTLEGVATFFRESLLSVELKHENIVEFVGACVRPPEICLVYEYCSGGDLASFLFTLEEEEEEEKEEEKEERKGDEKRQSDYKQLEGEEKGRKKTKAKKERKRKAKEANNPFWADENPPDNGVISTSVLNELPHSIVTIWTKK
ncbi:hypothetical protein RFI_11343 [Reticulomyxa filosa]|uniref:Protein kinase domain-containing protein n=1 Tax=Reticulomyxa filosa TaxID=46433 RepID=X6NHJ6_RETFI|nr:hypothetical protein RFI_11343 [Reticulomyxa filosa]|eukprot:ETO25795.1 hypothetical protein RFI_11343 [Reticulomyxa filosa]